jgi:hypothetical protein
MEAGAAPVTRLASSSSETVRGAFTFRYTGHTSLTVRGAVTGRLYYFAHAGADVAVDPRDAPAMSAVPRLQRT